jgi:hypothetical protein
VIGELEEVAEVVDKAEEDSAKATIDGLESKNVSLSEKLAQLEANSEDMKSRLHRAVEIGERFQSEAHDARQLAEEASIEAYKARAVSGFSNSSAVSQLLEGIDSEEVIDRIVSENARKTVGDPQLEAIRQRLKRGAVRDAPDALNEDESGQGLSTPVLGSMSVSDFRTLAGVRK